jgi:hypothetical protein
LQQEPIFACAKARLQKFAMQTNATVQGSQPQEGSYWAIRAATLRPWHGHLAIVIKTEQSKVSSQTDFTLSSPSISYVGSKH